MQNRKATVGPRGWAMLTLIVGAALASPFLRTPRVDVGAGTPQTSNTGTPLLAAGQPAPADWFSGPLPPQPTANQAAGVPARGAYDWSELTPAASNSLGSAPPQLPSWAAPPSPLDHLIAQGTAPPWQGDGQSATGPQPLQAWVGEAQCPTQTLDHSTSQASVWPPTNIPELKPFPDQPILPSPRGASPSSAGFATGQGSTDSSRPPGALAGTTLRSATAPSTTNHHERRAASPAASAPPSPSQFVYQPGFRAQATK